MNSSYDFILFNLQTIVIQFIILMIILWVLHRFLFKPYLSFLDKEAIKREKLDENFKKIEQLKADAEIERTKILEQARQEAEEIQKSANEIAKKESNKIKEKANNEAIVIKQSALNDIIKQKQSMLDGVYSKITDFVLNFNKKIFTKEPVNRDFLEKELKNLK